MFCVSVEDRQTAIASAAELMIEPPEWERLPTTKSRRLITPTVLREHLLASVVLLPRAKVFAGSADTHLLRFRTVVGAETAGDLIVRVKGRNVAARRRLASNVTTKKMTSPPTTATATLPTRRACPNVNIITTRPGKCRGNDDLRKNGSCTGDLFHGNHVGKHG